MVSALPGLEPSVAAWSRLPSRQVRTYGRSSSVWLPEPPRRTRGQWRTAPKPPKQALDPPTVPCEYSNEMGPGRWRHTPRVAQNGVQIGPTPAHHRRDHLVVRDLTRLSRRRRVGFRAARHSRWPHADSVGSCVGLAQSRWCGYVAVVVEESIVHAGAVPDDVGGCVSMCAVASDQVVVGGARAPRLAGHEDDAAGQSPG
jgi:hypothetical protein